MYPRVLRPEKVCAIHQGLGAWGLRTRNTSGPGGAKAPTFSPRVPALRFECHSQTLRGRVLLEAKRDPEGFVVFGASAPVGKLESGIWRKRRPRRRQR